MLRDENKVRYWSFIQVPNEIYESHPNEIQQLKDNQLKSLGFERLSHRSKVISFFTIRLNQSDRALATTIIDEKGNRHLLILEKIENHRHDNSKFLNPTLNDEQLKQKILKHIEKNQGKMQVISLGKVNASKEEKEEKKDKKEKSDKSQYRFAKTYFFNGKCLELDEDQAKVSAMEMPVMLYGEAGTGKTGVLNYVMDEQASKKEGEPVKKILYVATLQKLVNEMKKLRENDTSNKEKHAVELLTYRELLGKLVDLKKLTLRTSHDFAKWFAENKKHYQKTYDTNRKNSYSLTLINSNANTLYQEFRILCGYTEKDYKALGDRGSLFGSKDREHLLKLYKEYMQYLTKNHMIDSSFHAIEIKKEQQYDVIVLDEGQDLSPIEKKNIINLAKDYQVYISLSDRQKLYDCLSDISPLRHFGIKAGKPFSEIELTRSYRCPPNVVKLINRVIAIENILLEGGSRKNESRKIKSPTENVSLKELGEVIWVKENDSTNMEKVRTNLSNSATSAVIVLDEEDKVEAGKKFPGANIYTVEEIKGSELPYVVACLDVEKLKSSNTKLSEKKPEDCDLVLMSSPPDINSLNTLPIKSNAAYIRSKDKLFYVNKEKKECKEIEITKEKIKEFDQELEPTNSIRSLLEVELDNITSITNHMHAQERCRANRPKKTIDNSSRTDNSKEYAVLWNKVYTLVSRSLHTVVIILPKNEHGIAHVLKWLKAVPTQKVGILQPSSQAECLKEINEQKEAGNFKQAIGIVINHIDGSDQITSLLVGIFEAAYHQIGHDATQSLYKEKSREIPKEAAAECRKKINELNSKVATNKQPTRKTQDVTQKNEGIKGKTSNNGNTFLDPAKLSPLVSNLIPQPSTRSLNLIERKQIMLKCGEALNTTLLKIRKAKQDLELGINQKIGSDCKELELEYNNCKNTIIKNWRAILQSNIWIDILFKVEPAEFLKVKSGKPVSLLASICEPDKANLHELLVHSIISENLQINTSIVTEENITLTAPGGTMSVFDFLLLCVSTAKPREPDATVFHRLLKNHSIRSKITIGMLISALDLLSKETNEKQQTALELLLVDNSALLLEEKNIEIFMERLCRMDYIPNSEMPNLSYLHDMANFSGLTNALLIAMNINHYLAHNIDSDILFLHLVFDDNYVASPFSCFTQHQKGLEFLALLFDLNRNLIEKVSEYQLKEILYSESNNDKTTLANLIEGGMNGIKILDKLCQYHPFLIDELLMNDYDADIPEQEITRKLMANNPELKESFVAQECEIIKANQPGRDFSIVTYFLNHYEKLIILDFILIHDKSIARALFQELTTADNYHAEVNNNLFWVQLTQHIEFSFFKDALVNVLTSQELNTLIKMIPGNLLTRNPSWKKAYVDDHRFFSRNESMPDKMRSFSPLRP